MVKTFVRKSLALVLMAGITLWLSACEDSSGPRILVFTKTAGWHHESIPAGVAALQKLGAENGFEVDTTRDAH